MDALLLSVSQYLVLSMFWVGIPACLIAVLLVQGFRYRGRLAFVIAILGFATFALGILGFTLEGIVNEEMWIVSRRSGVVRKIDDVSGFWYATAFWLALSACIFSFAVWAGVRVARNPNHSFKADVAKATRP